MDFQLFKYSGVQIHQTYFYHNPQVDIQTTSKNSTSMLPYEGHEWKVEDFTWQRREFQWGQYKYPTIIYMVELHRQPTYYRHIFVIPSFLVAILTCFMFLLPLDSGERMALGEYASDICLSKIIIMLRWCQTT